MSGRVKKIILLALAAALFVAVSPIQRALNRDRERLGLTRIEPLENAPPVLAFTTVALGGFRGLIANALWIRATELQDADKFFEHSQLAELITKLEPHFVQVWLVQAWNMAYNISVKFKDKEDRWRWVRRGIELLRDDGLRYNPNETLIYRELAWFFQHKMGQNLDDWHNFYKQSWADEMAVVFAKKTPDLDELINPQTDDAKMRATLLREKYKMDPVFMKEVNTNYGPLDWRLPEAHAIYWASVGLQKAKENPTRTKPEELIQLRRAVYQSMQMSFQRGRMVVNPFSRTFELGPNIDIIPKVNAAYEQAMTEDVQNADHISTAHRNFLREAVYTLYGHNRIADAARWYQYLGEKYPNKTIIDGDTNSFPRNVTLNDYAIACIKVDVTETSNAKVQARIEEFITRAFLDLAIGEKERSAGYRAMARLLRARYVKETDMRPDALRIAPIEEIENKILDRLLDPRGELPFEVRAVLRAQTGRPPEEAAPADAGTNAPALK